MTDQEEPGPPSTPTSSPTLRVVIVDDHPLFRDGLTTLIEDTPGMSVAGEASTGEQAIELCATLKPDIVLMDVRMTGPIDGVEATRRIVDAGTAGAILVLTMLDDDATVFAAMRAGARGYTLKGASGADLLDAIRMVEKGNAVFGAAIAARMSRYFARPRTGGSAATFPQMSLREHEILDLLARGENNNTIAAHLVLSEKTIRNHVSTILTKLHVATRSEAIARARDAGLGAPAP